MLGAMAEIHRAAPGALRRLFIHIAIAAAIGVGVILAFEAARPALLEWAGADPARVRPRAQMLIALVSAVVLIPVLGAAAYMWRLGGCIVREDRFPPEGLAMIRDVPVVRGAAARSKGRLLQASALIFAAIATVMAIILWRLATLGGGR